MIGTMYKAMSGLQGFSKGLDIIGNNISNLNTPGFKGESMSFRDLFYRYSGGAGGSDGAQVGQGVETDSSRTNFAQGDFQATGNPLDIAVDGNGFLVLKHGNDLFYTRAGQLQIDSSGFLVDQSTGYHVQGLAGSSQIVDINISATKNSPQRATSTVTLSGNLTRNLGTTGTATHQIDSVTVYDSAGTAHTLQLQFSSSAPGVWTVNVLEPSVSATAIVGTGQIQYQGDGSPTAGSNTLAFTLAPAGTTASNIVLDFGAPGSFAGTTGFSAGTTSDARVASQDGYGPGALTKSTLDPNGTLVLTYSNGQTVNGPRLVLAWFQDLQALTPRGQSLFVDGNGQVATYEHPDEDVMGKLVSGKIELSNVALTEQFTEMIIIQRGYQASSQVSSVVNEMMQQVLNIQNQR
jgi:flagellar hook protein FlgE